MTTFKDVKLRPFQRKFLAGVLKPGISRACLSLPRGNGKSWLAGYLAAQALTPGGALWESGAENVLLSGSFDQARYCFRFAKEFLGEKGYSYLDSTNKLAIRHKQSGTRLLVRSSRAKGAFGIVGARLAIADEPGSFDTLGGEMMSDALGHGSRKTRHRSQDRLYRDTEPESRRMVARSHCRWLQRINVRAILLVAISRAGTRGRRSGGLIRWSRSALRSGGLC